MAALVGTATAAGLAWSITVGTAAGASTRIRSGSLHAQLVSHVSTGANALSPGLAGGGSDVMAVVVGAMAVSALAFLIVTFIRRRVTIA
jgi:hypothetical protein